MAQKWRGEPEIVTLPDVTVATVHTSGNPEGLGADVMEALYGAVYGLKFALKKRGVEMKMGGAAGPMGMDSGAGGHRRARWRLGRAGARR
ncbi:MAG TPA: hypothetical protein VIK38_04670, partial [Coriobacteriia bacterium]